MDKTRAEKLIKEHVREHMPDEIKRLAAYAYADLHFGPDHNGLDPDAPFPGFESACATVAAWLRDNVPSELWVDLDCDHVSDTAPEAFEEDEDGNQREAYLDETVGFDRRDILRATFGDLAEYLR